LLHHRCHVHAAWSTTSPGSASASTLHLLHHRCHVHAARGTASSSSAHHFLGHLHHSSHATSTRLRLNLLNHVGYVSHAAHLVNHGWVKGTLQFLHHRLGILSHSIFIHLIKSHIAHFTHHFTELFVFAQEAEELSRMLTRSFGNA
jgi:hypothetical protein